MSSSVGTGALSIGGVDANALAAAYGTPLLALDGERLDRNVALFARAQRELGIEVSYAAKAMFFVAIARRVARGGLGIDVCSLGELVTAERAGVPAAKLTMHGCGKTGDELQAALDGRVGRIAVDGLDEISRLTALAAGHAAAPIDVLVRVNTGLEAHTHAYVRTGGEDSKFGVALDEIDAALEAVARAPGLRLTGVHSHIGSQIFEVNAFVENVALALDAYAKALDRSSHVRDLVLGGGFGVDAHPDGEQFPLRGTLERIVAEVVACARSRRLAPPRVGFEPGRALVAEAGTSLYRVVAVKRQGTRRFAIVDGSLADNPRPALYGAYHHPGLAGRRSTAATAEFAVCGRSCESDVLVEEALLPSDLAPGDLLSLGTTGAYTYSMAGNYNRFPRPAVAFAEGGGHRLVVRRETLEDLLRADVVEADAG